jgi:hypothetical protein
MNECINASDLGYTEQNPDARPSEGHCLTFVPCKLRAHVKPDTRHSETHRPSRYEAWKGLASAMAGILLKDLSRRVSCHERAHSLHGLHAELPLVDADNGVEDVGQQRRRLGDRVYLVPRPATNRLFSHTSSLRKKHHLLRTSIAKPTTRRHESLTRRSRRRCAIPRKTALPQPADAH